MIRACLLLAFLPALLATAAEPVWTGFGLTRDVNLEDERLAEENLRPAIDPDLPEEQRKQIEALLAAVPAGPPFEALLLDDRALSVKTRDQLRRIYAAYQQALVAHAKKYDPLRRADPLFDAKLHAAGAVAVDHVKKLTTPRGGGVLPTYKCTDPREHSRAYYQAVTSVQAFILKQKYGIDWTPPPRCPDLGPNVIADIQRGVPPEIAAGFIVE